jgi:hypothetical protein
MKYSLVDIVEQQLIIQQPDHVDEQQNVLAKWRFVPDFLFRTPSELAVRITATIDAIMGDTQEKLFVLDVVHVFRLEDVPSYYPLDLTHSLTDKAKMELATFVGISIGTVRGLAYARTAGAFGKDLIMPVVNPTALLEHHILQISEASQSSE